MSIICSKVLGEGCIIYNNWLEETTDNRLDIISLINKKYSCLALTAIYDAETGITENKELENRINSDKTTCSIIESLNNDLIARR